MEKKEEKQNNQFIWFNGDELQCWNCYGMNIQSEYYYAGERQQQTTISFGLGNKIIDLDPTIMKKIAKYNAEKEVELLIRKKQLLEDELKLLEEQKQGQVKRIDELKNFCKDFINSNNSSINEYIDSHYDDDYDD